ncbi:hypothetical protein TNCV_2060321 [Trichonephila clavipes]|nr:hypothetical protein TNCV_2060321 [Trichonephila clavipes]
MKDSFLQENLLFAFSSFQRIDQHGAENIGIELKAVAINANNSHLRRIRHADGLMESENIYQIDCPAKSRDFNPIEDI